MFNRFLFAWIVLNSSTTNSSLWAAPIVWSGYDHSFTKVDWVDPFSAEGQDSISPSTSLTRLNTGGGLLNVVTETNYEKLSSPSGTRWAFRFSNPNQVIAAWNYPQLNFLPWADAFGSNGAGGPPSTLGQSAVAHLVAEDIYLDWRLTAWTVRAGGGFTYERASGAAMGDYNADGLITSNDYLAWYAAFGSGATLPDGNRNGIVDAADYTLWRDRFTVVTPLHTVPEPQLVVTLTITLLAAASGRFRCCSSRSQQ